MSEEQSKDEVKELQELQERNQRLQEEVRRLKGKPEGRIGYVLLALGFLLIALAVYYSHNVAAFLGVALTFWGALLLYVRPTSFIRKEVLDSTATEPQQSITRLINEFGYQGTPKHISPGTLWGMNNTVLWIPKKEGTRPPTDEQLSSQEVTIQEPPGLVITPPGQGLSRLIEEELNTNFTTVDLDYLTFNLEKALVEGLEIAESFTMETENPLIKIEAKGTIFNDVIQRTNTNGESLRIGDPFNSALASILARTTRQPVTIESIEIDEEETIRSKFKLHEAPGEKNRGIENNWCPRWS